MKHGIYYAYWEKEWGGDYLPYVEKVAKLGFDVLEISCAGFADQDVSRQRALRQAARDHGITITGGYGPQPCENIASRDPAVRQNALDLWARTFKAMDTADIRLVGGGLYSYWPVCFDTVPDKEGDWGRSVEGVQKMAAMAQDYGITLCMEVLNRFEGYLLNTAQEGCDFVDQVGCDNVKLMLDTFHMNIEEDSMGGAIRLAGDRLGHFHTGECNRRVPGAGRMPWHEIGEALRDIGYDGTVVMEPFVNRGGKIGSDIHIWRDLPEGADQETLDQGAQNALTFSRFVLG